jgi:hypothetical protein
MPNKSLFANNNNTITITVKNFCFFLRNPQNPQAHARYWCNLRSAMKRFFFCFKNFLEGRRRMIKLRNMN